MINIAIIGGGVIGLSAAVELQTHFRSSAKITVYSEKLSPNTTGDISAGLWTIYLVSDPNSRKILEWGTKTHKRFIDLWKSGQADEAGLSLLPVRLMLEDEAAWLEGKVVFGGQTMSKSQVDEANQKLKTHYPSGVSFVTFTCQVSKYLPFISKIFWKNGGKIVVKKIEALEELDSYDAIINCSGLNARTLVNDSKVLPIRGQVMRVKAPWQFHVFLGGRTYVIPNQDNVILGGTAQYGDFDEGIRKEDEEKIARECVSFIPSLKNAEIVNQKTGLRPGRSEIRLEAEKLRINGREVLVVHNYGHGGAGVTLSYGCALDVVKIVQKAMNVKHKSKL